MSRYADHLKAALAYAARNGASSMPDPDMPALKSYKSRAARQRVYRDRRHLKAGTGDYALTDKVVDLYETEK